MSNTAKVANRPDDLPTPILGPQARAASRLPVGGTKRQKLITVIGAYADAGEQRIPVRVLAERCRLHRRAVVTLLDALERDGFLSIERGDSGKQEINRYGITARV